MKDKKVRKSKKREEVQQQPVRCTCLPYISGVIDKYIKMHVLIH